LRRESRAATEQQPRRFAMGNQTDQVQNPSDPLQDPSQRQPGKEHPTVDDDRSRESDPAQGDEGNKPQRDREDRIGTPKDPRPIVRSPQDDAA
jgi:hypothetical protein